MKFDALAAPVANHFGVARQRRLGGVRHQVDQMAANRGQHLVGPFLKEFGERCGVDPGS